jgi:hypothetical protein
MNRMNEFEKAAQEKQLSLPAQFLLFLMDNKKWWLLPIVIVLGLVGLLAAVGGTGAAPFIYTMF